MPLRHRGALSVLFSNRDIDPQTHPETVLYWEIQGLDDGCRSRRHGLLRGRGFTRCRQGTSVAIPLGKNGGINHEISSLYHLEQFNVRTGSNGGSY